MGERVEPRVGRVRREGNECRRGWKEGGSRGRLEGGLAGCGRGSHRATKEGDGKTYCNSGGLLRVDLLGTCPHPDYIKCAFANRLAHISRVSQGSLDEQEDSDLHKKSVTAYEALSDETKALFSLLAENIQLKHYAPRIRSTRQIIQQVLDQHQGEGEVPLLQIKFELLTKNVAESIPDKL